MKKLLAIYSQDNRIKSSFKCLAKPGQITPKKKRKQADVQWKLESDVSDAIGRSDLASQILVNLSSKSQRTFF